MSPDRHVPYYVAAYAASVLVIGWMTLDTWLRARRWRRRAEQLEKARKP
jgi:heme exporter protein CcmD